MPRKFQEFYSTDAASRIFAAGGAGAVAGVVAATLDIRQAFWTVDGPAAVAALALQAVARVGMAGLLLGVVAGCLAIIGERVARRLGGAPARGAELLVGLALAPVMVYVAQCLFQGGQMSRLPGRAAWAVAAASALVVVAFIAARWVFRLLRRAEQTDRLPLSLVAVAVLSCVLALGLRWCDAHLYRRLYFYLHGLLAFGTLSGLAIGARLLFFRGPGSKRRTGGIALIAALLIVSMAVAAPTLGARQVVKVSAFENTATLSNILRATAVPGRRQKKFAWDEEMRRARRERARARQLADQGRWPVHEGAHVVLISIDALRADRLGTYGYDKRQLSVGIDKFARRKAMVFERAYCAAPHSSYSTTAIHTSHPTRDEAKLGRDTAHPTLAEVLGDQGYVTRAFYTQGIFHTEGDKVGHYRRSKFGFEKVTHGAPPPELLTDKAIEFMDSVVRGGEPPTFLWLHYFNVHEPYEDSRFGTSPEDRYEGEIFAADQAIGRLLEYLDTHLGRDVVVVLTADHGEEFGDHGGHYHGSSLYDEQARVPLIISSPGARPGRFTPPVSALDIAPTVLGLAGAAVPAGMMGRDLRPVLFGEASAAYSQPVFSSVMHQQMVASGPWKLIADFGRDVFELYQLDDDPREKNNRYDAEPEVGGRLLAEIYGWLDEVGAASSDGETALNLGRMRDPRAARALVQLAANGQARVENRVAALELLADIDDRSCAPLLLGLLDDDDERVAIGAALALGPTGNPQAAELMRLALYDVSAAVRDRAALALGRQGDPVALPALLESLGRDDFATRENAIRYLGQLGDPAATESLIDALGEDRLRYLAVLALGKIGDQGAYDAVVEVLDNDSHDDVRGYAVVALGWLADRRAVPRLVRMLTEQTDIKWTSEALVRLGAVGALPVAGTDVAAGQAALKSGWGPCATEPLIVHGDFLGRTTCRTRASVAKLRFGAGFEGPVTVIVRARHLSDEAGATVPLTLTLGSRELHKVALTGSFEEFRFTSSAPRWRDEEVTVTLRLGAGGAFEVDHFLVVAQ